jgi:hypothetical protein
VLLLVLLLLLAMLVHRAMRQRFDTHACFIVRPVFRPHLVGSESVWKSNIYLLVDR